MRNFDPLHLALWVMLATLIAIRAYLYFWAAPGPVLRIQMEGTSQFADDSSHLQPIAASAGNPLPAPVAIMMEAT